MKELRSKYKELQYQQLVTKLRTYITNSSSKISLTYSFKQLKQFPTP